MKAEIRIKWEDGHATEFKSGEMWHSYGTKEGSTAMQSNLTAKDLTEIKEYKIKEK